MSSYIENQLNEINQLISYGKLKEAYEKVEEELRNKGICKENELFFLNKKSEIEYYLGNFQESLKIADYVLKESEKIDNKLIQVDALINKSPNLIWTAKVKEGIDIAEKGLNLIDTVKNFSANIIAERKARLLIWKGGGVQQLGDFEKGTELFEEAFSFAEESGNKFVIAFCQANLGLSYIKKGKLEKGEELLEKAYTIANEFGNKLLIAIIYAVYATLSSFRRNYEQAIDFLLKTMDYAKEIGSTLLLGYYVDLGFVYLNIFDLDKALEYYQEALKYTPLAKHITYSGIGYTYFLKYELEKAQEFYLKSMKISEEISDKRILPYVIYNLISISLELNNLTQAKKYLEKLEKIHKETGFVRISYLYRFASIRILKASGNIGDLFKSVELLDAFLAEENLPSYWRLDLLYTMLEIRIKELQLSSDEKAIEKVKKQAIRLEVEAEELQQKQLLVNVFRLQSQLALIELDAQKAIKLLGKAQAIAEEIDIELLKKAIREDQEKIEKQLSMWNKLQEQEAPIKEAIKHVSLEHSMKNIKQETVLEERDEETGKIIEYRKLFALKI